nr:RNA-directed DNA polymerase, eukaryota [Tanacetum cinerariifolium]
MGDRRSKEDDVRRISTSIFVTNFPEEFKAHDLWRICTQYGTVIDAFIPNRRSKSANSNVEKSNVVGCTQKEMGVHGHSNSFVQAVKRGHLPTTVAADQKPALVLDDSCTSHMYFSLSVVAKLKEFALLPNLKSTLAEEGFDDIIIHYMGGFWVLVQLVSNIQKDKFWVHVGVGSWFSKLQPAYGNFKIDERVVWIDIKGVPVCAWSHNTFARIASKWGVLLHDEDEEASFFHRKRQWWTLDFDKCDEPFSDFDNDSLGVNSEEIKSKANSEVDSDVEEIPETIFEQGDQDGFKSKKKPCPNVSQQTVGEPKYPLGFTPKDVSEVSSNIEHEEVNVPKVNHEEENVLKPMKKDHKPISNEDIEDSMGSGHFKSAGIPKTGGSILQLMEDLINDSNMFHKEHSTVFDYFIAIMGTWVQSDKNMLIILVYAPQELGEKKMLWQYLNHLIDRWKGEVIVMGDFNEVRNQEEIFGSIFNVQGAAAFNSFISSGGLVEVPFGGYSFTWCHKSASKMSKLDHFLISEGLMRYCPNISAITLDRHLSDHKPIVLREINFDYGPTPFLLYHYWLLNKLRQLKKEVHSWVKDNKEKNKNEKQNLKTMLADIDLSLDKGVLSSDILEKRINIMHKLTYLEKKVSFELAQKANIKWSIDGDENSKYFHGIINKHKSNLAIRGILVDGVWIEDPSSVKNEFLNHFKDRFQTPYSSRLILDMEFPNKLSLDQRDGLERPFTKEEIKGTVWDCGLNKSLGPDGFTFGFFRRYWSLIESDVVDAANYFYDHGFYHTRAKKNQTMIFKVDFEKAFDSVRWDFLDDVLKKFRFGDRWCHWIQSFLSLSRGSILVNGSPTSEFQFHKGLKQGDPLSPFLFHIMESLHLSFQKVVNAGLFKGVVLDNSLQISHLFYADDVVFVGKWYDSNINMIVHVLECFFRASCLRINMHKSMIMGVAVENTKVTLAAANIGCMILKAPFNYLGVKVGGRMSRISFWDESTNKLLSRLSKWKMKTLSIGGRLTLLKSVLGSLPIYYMSMFKVPLQDVIPFKSLYPRLFALESDKKVTVATKMANSDFCSSLWHMPRSGVEHQQLMGLRSKVEGLILPNIRDRWYWSLSGNGEFSIASV